MDGGSEGGEGLTWYLFMSITLSSITEVSIQYTVQSSLSPTGRRPNLRATRLTTARKYTHVHYRIIQPLPHPSSSDLALGSYPGPSQRAWEGG